MFVAGPAISRTSAAPGDMPFSISAAAIGIDPVAQRYMGTEKSSTSNMFFIGVSAYCSKKVVGTKTVISPAITNPITNHLPIS